MITELKTIWKELKEKEKKLLKLGLIGILVFGAISIFVLPLLLTLPAKYEILDFSQKGPVGDTINGIAGPFIALLASILTFLAFYIQYKANIQQREQFTKTLEEQEKANLAQDKIWRIERFENRFFELLKFHKANVDEMNIGDKIYRSKCFVPMFYELRFCYLASKVIYEYIPDDLKKLNKVEGIDLMKFAYTIFFFGIGTQSEKHYLPNFSDGEKHLHFLLTNLLEDIQNQYSEYIEQNPNSKYFHATKFKNYQIEDDRSTEFYYFPFDGHMNRLGHYYRHLFQTANYIIEQNMLTFEERYGYVKTLRAQLTNFEQLLLYYNSVSWFRTEWKILLTDYRLIKNIPLPIADFYKTPEEYFSAEVEELNNRGITMFEGHE